MKKEATPENAKGLIRKSSDEKEATRKKLQMSSFKRPPLKKEATPEKCIGAHSKDLQ
jgi:hypothetical protein